MDLLIYFALGWFCGSLYTTYQHIKNIRRIAKERGMNLDNMVEMASQSQGSTIPVLTVERQDNIIYLYEKENNTFVAQGLSFEELAKKTLEQKIRVALVLDGEKELWFYDGQLKEKGSL